VLCGNCGRSRGEGTRACSCVPEWVWWDPEMVAAVRSCDAQRAVRFLRRQVHSLSQETLARMCGVAQSTITRAEAGRGLTDRRKAVEALRGLGAFEAVQGAAVHRKPRPVPLLRETQEGREQKPATEILRRLVSAYDMPADGPVRSIDELQREVAEVVKCRLNSRYTDLLARLPVLLPELSRALATSRGLRRDRVARLLVQTYRAADAIADKLGLHDLSARTIQVMLWAAEQTEDQVTRAAAAYVRGEVFFCNRDFQTGRLVLERAAQGLTPATPYERAAYGALHMRAAVLAARGQSPARAQAHLREAHTSAELMREGVYAGTAFGPGSVRIHEITLALEANDPDRALATAAGWSPPKELPAERASHFYIDVAHAQMQVHHPERTLEALGKAWTAAPEHIRFHPQVTTILKRLGMSGGTQASAAREFATAIGLTVL